MWWRLKKLWHEVGCFDGGDTPLPDPNARTFRAHAMRRQVGWSYDAEYLAEEADAKESPYRCSNCGMYFRGGPTPPPTLWDHLIGED